MNYIILLQGIQGIKVQLFVIKVKYDLLKKNLFNFSSPVIHFAKKLVSHHRMSNDIMI